MEAVLVSAKVSVFYSKISRLSPSLPNGSTWHKHQLNTKNTTKTEAI